MISRALLSVYDKTGVVAFAAALAELGVEIVSSGGTAQALAEAGISHLQVEEVTGFPEMLDGRVKTLHPRIHGGILADRGKQTHLDSLAFHGIAPIDLVVCNLYPFGSDPSVELIDVGGPSMVRGAAKNHASVGVVIDPADYLPVLEELRTHGSLQLATRRSLAAKAFAHTSAYDLAIADWLSEDDVNDDTVAMDQVLPERMQLELRRADVLRYGENPHQVGARYRIKGQRGWPDTAIQHGGKPMSYLNVYDTDAAWRLVHDLGEDEPAAVVIKHANPCGAAISGDIESAYRKAHSGDPVSAFGGIIAVNRTVTPALAELISGVFTEVVIAPAFTAEALELLAVRKAMRVLEADRPGNALRHMRSIDGGMLIQSLDRADSSGDPRSKWQVVSKAQPDEMVWRDLELAWRVCAHVSSNAIVIATDGSAVGIGGGQQSRLDSARLAVTKAGDRARGAVAASDAFFPFRDGLDTLAEAGIRAVVETGGSVRDDEVIAAADEHGIVLVFTGVRHFRH